MSEPFSYDFIFSFSRSFRSYFLHAISYTLSGICWDTEKTEMSFFSSSLELTFAVVDIVVFCISRHPHYYHITSVWARRRKRFVGNKWASSISNSLCILLLNDILLMDGKTEAKHTKKNEVKLQKCFFLLIIWQISFILIQFIFVSVVCRIFRSEFSSIWP